MEDFEDLDFGEMVDLETFGQLDAGTVATVVADFGREPILSTELCFALEASHVRQFCRSALNTLRPVKSAGKAIVVLEVSECHAVFSVRGMNMFFEYRAPLYGKPINPPVNNVKLAFFAKDLFEAAYGLGSLASFRVKLDSPSARVFSEDFCRPLPIAKLPVQPIVPKAAGDVRANENTSMFASRALRTSLGICQHYMSKLDPVEKFDLQITAGHLLMRRSSAFLSCRSSLMADLSLGVDANVARKLWAVLPEDAMLRFSRAESYAFLYDENLLIGLYDEPIAERLIPSTKSIGQVLLPRSEFNDSLNRIERALPNGRVIIAIADVGSNAKISIAAQVAEDHFIRFSPIKGVFNPAMVDSPPKDVSFSVLTEDVRHACKLGTSVNFEMHVHREFVVIKDAIDDEAIDVTIYLSRSDLPERQSRHRRSR